MRLRQLENKQIHLEGIAETAVIVSAHYYSRDEVELVVDSEVGRFVVKRPYSKIRTEIRRIGYGSIR